MKITRRSLLLSLAAAFACASAALAADSDPGFKPLFNGKDLKGWDGNPKLWSVKDGVVIGKTTAEEPIKPNTFLIWRDGTVDDFVLRFSYRIKGGNSGVQYRSKEMKEVAPWVVGGYQADFEAGKTYSGILYEERGPRGIMAERGTKVVVDEGGKKNVVEKIGDSADLQSKIKNEDWNEYEVTAQGFHFIHKINGNVTADVQDNDTKNRAASGILALQLHAGPPMQVEFKDVRIKRLPLDSKKKVLVAGEASHGKGEHEFNAGVQLLQKALANQPGVLATYHLSGWPKDTTAFDNADAILFYMNGGDGHAAIQGDHLAQLDRLAKKGVGLAFAHYGVEVPKTKGGPEFLRWSGGYFETFYSVNPTWEADFKSLPNHPITRGVKSFKIRDEWYYNMRFADSGVTYLLTAIPPDNTRQGKDDAHGGNAFVRANKGRPEHLAWAIERPDGGRGFGFTGGHYHKNWGDENFRKLFLNALLWVAKAEVPPNGVESAITAEDLEKNWDPK